MNFLAKKLILNKLDKEDKKYIAPYFRLGAVTARDLRKIAQICEKFPESKIKLTGEIIIGGIKDAARNEECRRALNLPLCSVAGFSLRPVKVCSGGYICDNNVQDSLGLGSRLDEIFSGRKLPFKMIISVSGCARCCSEPLVKDIGIVSTQEGFSLYVGGAAGAKPRISLKLADGLKADEVMETIEKIVGLYEKKGKTPERLGAFIEKMGFGRFKEEVIK